MAQSICLRQMQIPYPKKRDKNGKEIIGGGNMGKEKKGLSRKEFLRASAVGAGVVGSAGILSAPQKARASGSGV